MRNCPANMESVSESTAREPYVYSQTSPGGAQKLGEAKNSG
jgi:hypothetical protein